MRKDEAKSILLKTIPCPYKDNEKICHHLQEGGGDCESCYEEALDTILNLVEKQQKEIEEKNIAINKMSKDISRQLEEIEEKRIIIFAGAEKVKQLEKEIENLKTNYKRLQNTEAVHHIYIKKDKIREKIKKAKEIKWHTPKLVIEYFEELLEQK